MGNSATRIQAALDRKKRIRAKVSDLSGMESGGPRFVADVMLGRLAKWLRIAGFDVLYSNTFSDDELVQISIRDNRVLLSRDTRLLIKKSVSRFLYLESQNLHNQVLQVFELLRVSRFPEPLTRCLVCNAPLQAVQRESVRARVPPFVYRTHTRYKSCPLCGRIFWAGTHRKAAVLALEKMRAGVRNWRLPVSETAGSPGKTFEGHQKEGEDHV